MPSSDSDAAAAYTGTVPGKKTPGGAGTHTGHMYPVLYCTVLTVPVKRHRGEPVPGLYRFEHTGGSGTHAKVNARFRELFIAPIHMRAALRVAKMRTRRHAVAYAQEIHVTEPTDESLCVVNELSGLFDAQKHGDRASSPPAV